MSTPNITFSIQPEENGKFVYLRVAPFTANDPASSMVNFRLRIRNNDTEDATLSKIRVSFPGHPALTQEFPRDQTIGPDKTITLYLTPDESMQLPASPPSKIRVGVFVEGHASPKEIQRDLAAHESPTPQKSYRFPGNTNSMEFNEYFTQKPRHTGGTQTLGYDISNRGWNATLKKFASHRTGTDGTKNEHRFGWNQPLHAMGDGIVIKGADDFPDNPKPGKRAVIRTSDHTSGKITATSAAAMSGNRTLTAVRTASGKLKVIVYDYPDDGTTLTRKGDAVGTSIQKVSVIGTKSNRAVTASRTATGALPTADKASSASASSSQMSRKVSSVSTSRLMGSSKRGNRRTAAEKASRLLTGALVISQSDDPHARRDLLMGLRPLCNLRGQPLLFLESQAR